MFHVNRVIFLLIIAFGNPFLGKAQQGVAKEGAAGKGSTPVTVSINEIIKLEKENPSETGLRIRAELEAGNRHKLPSPEALPGHRFPAGEDYEITRFNVTQTVHSNFQGIQLLGESNSIPPDPMGAVSHTQICIISNGRIKFYPKPGVCDAPVVTSTTTNTSGSLPNPVFSATLDNFFSSVRGGSGVTDPHLYFDRLSERWYVIAINIANASNRIMIAVSNSANITGQSSFNFLFFNHDNGAPANNADRGAFCDYPMLGVDKHALYIGGLIFNSSGNFTGSSVYVVNKASLLSGGNLQFTAFRQVGLLNSGIFAPQGVYNDDPEATRGYFVGVDNEVFSRLRYIVVNNPGSASPTITQAAINVPTTYYPYLQPALGSNIPLDALGDERLLGAQMMRNKITGQSTIQTAHNIAVNTNGIAVNDDNITTARNAVRWYQLNDNNGTLTLGQSGTLFDNAGTNPRGYWMGSMATSGQGHAVVSSSVAAPNLHANVIVAGRFASQSAGALNPPVNATNFSNTYNRETTGESQRWGDYSQTVVDPSDDMTIWTFQQYTNATNSWAVRAVQLKAPPPATPTSLSPIVCDVNRNAVVTLTGQATDFAGFFDPGPPRGGGPAYPKRLAVTSTGNVTISNIELQSATQIRFQMNFATATLGSQQTLTITNPDCQQVTFNYTLPASCDSDPVVPGAGFRVQENPVVGTMVVFLPASTGSLRLIASDGKIVGTYQVTNTTMNIPTAQFAAGVYFLEYTGNDKTEVIRLLIR
jgi:hypothetical protein